VTGFSPDLILLFLGFVAFLVLVFKKSAYPGQYQLPTIKKTKKIGRLWDGGSEKLPS